MSDTRTVKFELSCLGCLGLLVISAAALGLAWGLMTGVARWAGGLFS